MMESRIKKILIIDDALTVRMYHKQLMEQLGFAVEEAVNGLEALEKIQDFQPDACLVDVNMPKMDGYRFIKELRNDEALRHIPCIMISTEAEQHDKEKAYAAGANFYIVKPAKVDELQNISRLIAGAA